MPNRWVIPMLVIAAATTSIVPVTSGQTTAICHFPGTPAEQTLFLPSDPSTIAAHLAHGDRLGGCQPTGMPYTCSASAQPFETLYVRPGVSGATGTNNQTFESISSALKFAEIRRISAVEVQVAAGIYGPDAATVSRPTRIVGEGPLVELALSIMNTSPHELGVQGVRFSSSSAGPSITVSHADASTALCNIVFSEQQGHALSQTGGSLFADNVIFESIRRDPAANDQDYVSGTAIALRGGVLAFMQEVEVHGTDGSALYVEGIGTEVMLNYSARSIPPDTAAITGSLGCLGAVAVTAGAYLSSSRLTLDDNRLFGVAVYGQGSHAEFEFLRVTNTRTLQEGDVNFPLCGGEVTVASAAAFTGATLYVSGSADEPFLLSGSDLVGVYIVGIMDSIPDVRLSNGIVTNNPIGVAIDVDGCNAFDLTKLEDDVRYIDNEVNLDSPCLPVPKPSVELNCSDGIDDDGDGLTDGADPDCTGSATEV